MIPESTSPVPAVASDGRPDPAQEHVGTASTGAATAVSDPFSSTTAPVAAASRAAGVEPVAARRPSRHAGELPVVRREHGRSAPPPRGAWRAAGLRRRARSARRRRSPRAWGQRPRRPESPPPSRGSVPSPGPITTALHFCSRIEERSSPLAAQAGACAPPRSARPPRGRPGGPRRTMPAPAPWRPGCTGRPRPPSRPSRRPRRRRGATCCPRVPRGGSRAASASSTRSAAGTGKSMPMSATCTRPLRAGPSPWRSPGFRAAKVTVASARTGRPDAAPESASMPDGRSTASTVASAGGRGRVVGAAEPGAVGGVDHEVARAAAPLGASLASSTATRAPRRASAGGGHPSVGAVVPLPATTTHAPPVGAAEQTERRVRRRGAGPVHQGLVSWCGPGPPRRPPASPPGSGRDARVARGRGRQTGGRRGLLRDDERDGHVVVWVSETWKRARPRRRGQRRRARGAAPGTDARRPGPTPDRRTSTSVSANAPRPRPSAFITASLAAKRAARLWPRVDRPDRVGPLGLGEAPLGEPGPALEHPPEAVDVDGVDAHARRSGAQPRPAHSTVTVLARLRGPVDVVAVQAGQVVGEQLERHDVDHRREQRVDRRDQARGPPPPPTRSSPSLATSTTVAPRLRPPRCWRASSPTAGCAWRPPTTTVPGSIRAIGPCLSSPAG